LNDFTEEMMILVLPLAELLRYKIKPTKQSPLKILLITKKSGQLKQYEKVYDNIERVCIMRTSITTKKNM